jgi:outer membrane protein OmpA-like peptidoglycan-associated protein
MRTPARQLADLASMLALGGLVAMYAPESNAASQVPLCKGLQVVTAISEDRGDYESIKTIDDVGAKEARVTYSAEVPDNALLADEGAIKRVTEKRRIRVEDLRSATHYLAVFAEVSDGYFPGTTSLGLSTATMQSLKTKGQAAAEFTFNARQDGVLRSDRQAPSNIHEWIVKAKLERLGPIKVPVLVNDRRVELDGIRVRALFDVEPQPSEFIFLDDEANPLTLRFNLARSAGTPPALPGMAETCAEMRKFGMPVDDAMCGAAESAAASGSMKLGWAAGGASLTVVKINHPCGHAETGSGSSLEQSLQEERRADIYSIFFSFNSAEIREESRPTLAEIAALLRKHPDWKLGIYGHTDNVASDKYNLELSGRRAAAVMHALTQNYGVSAERLSYGGQGEASPKDRNDTLEGRARNRRVELIRLP